MMLFVPPIEFRPPLPRTKISKALTTYETSQVGGVDALSNRPLAIEGTSTYGASLPAGYTWY